MNRLAVLGHPVAHSRSPAMQNAALEALRLSGEWSYEAIDIEPAEFGERVRELPSVGFVGANVTIPHKRAALELADRRSDAAAEIGAANTLSFREGSIQAENTDASGLLAVLPRPLEVKTALVLGAGGSARAAVWALAGEGIAVSVWNRTPERTDELVRDLPASRASGAQAEAGGYEVIVNSTAVGMADEDPFEELPLDPELFNAGITLVDLVYAGSESRLVREARERKATAIDGLEILVRQGAESLRIWTGMDPPLDLMRAAAASG